VRRGEIYEVLLPEGNRPAVIATRDTAIELLTNITVAPVTGTARGLVSEVPVGKGNGLRRESVVSCDNLATVPKRNLGRRYGALNPEQTFNFDVAIRIALGLDH
jgi:mRNA interferase MazF